MSTHRNSSPNPTALVVLLVLSILVVTIYLMFKAYTLMNSQGVQDHQDSIQELLKDMPPRE